MSIFEIIDRWTERGILIEYQIIDQLANGDPIITDKIVEGKHPVFTYTVTATDNETGDHIYAVAGFIKLEEAITSVVDYMEKQEHKYTLKG
ncbi:hypothetical protein [Shouchella clausii]|uniref:hypothetical protein n=1 Tax=Shouchella clausii TaxID=79880 RepID=UPI001C72DE61|nr:hypothetical protein [Shouchella clausii]MBX0320126.1 hypothetical protein [Shouchella clausii]